MPTLRASYLAHLLDKVRAQHRSECSLSYYVLDPLGHTVQNTVGYTIKWDVDFKSAAVTWSLCNKTVESTLLRDHRLVLDFPIPNSDELETREFNIRSGDIGDLVRYLAGLATKNLRVARFSESERYT